VTAPDFTPDEYVTLARFAALDLECGWCDNGHHSVDDADRCRCCRRPRELCDLDVTRCPCGDLVSPGDTSHRSCRWVTI